MQNNDLVKYEGGLIKRVGNAISITSKLLELAEPILIPYRKKDKWGFCTPDKKIVIDCVYDSVDFFYEGLASVSINGKYGFINSKNEIVIDFEYDNAQTFHKNAAIIKKNSKYGIINKSNQLIVELKYDKLYYRKDHFIHIEISKKSGLLDMNFKEVIPIQFEEIGIFSTEGLACFRTRDLFGYLNKEGKIVITQNYESAEDFKNGIAVVQQKGEYYFIDITGKRINTLSYKYLDSNYKQEGNLYPCSKDDIKFGIIDNYGNEIIPFIYDYVDFFSNNLAVVYKDDKAGFIDKNNQIKIPFQFDKAFRFSNGLARVEKNGKQGFINVEGNLVVPFLYDEGTLFTYFENGYVEVSLNGNLGIIDKSGNLIVPFEFCVILYDEENDIFLVKESDDDRNFFYLSKNGIKYCEE